MKRLSSAPCLEWVDKLLASHTDVLSLPEYLVLKEHLLTCPACTEAHNRYLSVEAQLRSLPVLQPQRLLSAELLSAENVGKRTVRRSYARPRSTPVPRAIEVLQRYTAVVLTACYKMLYHLVARMRKPAYAFMAMLFCLLATAAGAGTVNYALHNSQAQQTHAPHLAVSTTDLTLSSTTVAPSNMYLASQNTIQQPWFAIGTLMLHNTGERTLMWNVDNQRSIIAYMPEVVRIWTNPSQGILGSNEHTPVQVMAGSIARESLPLKQDVVLGSIFFASNGGEVAIHTVLKSAVSSAQKITNPPYLLDTKQPAALSTLPGYVFRKQNF